MRRARPRRHRRRRGCRPFARRRPTRCTGRSCSGPPGRGNHRARRRRQGVSRTLLRSLATRSRRVQVAGGMASTRRHGAEAPSGVTVPRGGGCCARAGGVGGRGGSLRGLRDPEQPARGPRRRRARARATPIEIPAAARVPSSARSVVERREARDRDARHDRVHEQLLPASSSSPSEAACPSSTAANTISSCSASSLRRNANTRATPAIAGSPSEHSNAGPMAVAMPCHAPVS